MISKKKICSVCLKECFLFSGGKCKQCASKDYKLKKSPLKKQASKLSKQTDKTKQKRSEERDCYTEFFQRHINIIKTENKCCEECGSKLTGDVSNVAHILSKSKHKDLACKDENVIYLCGVFGGNGCHSKFDSSLSVRYNMSCFHAAAEKIKHIEVTKMSKEYLQILEYLNQR